MVKKNNKSKNQKENMISQWEYLVGLYHKARSDSSLKKWGKFCLEILKFAGIVILRLVLKKIIQHFFEDFWIGIFGEE